MVPTMQVANVHSVTKKGSTQTAQWKQNLHAVTGHVTVLQRSDGQQSWQLGHAAHTPHHDVRSNGAVSLHNIGEWTNAASDPPYAHDQHTW